MTAVPVQIPLDHIWIDPGEQNAQNAPPLDSMSKVYVPTGRALEYAPFALNLYRGCAHACAYCYAPSATRTKRETFATQVQPRAGDETAFFGAVDRDAAILAANGISGPVVFCFTCDPYQPIDRELAYTRQAIHVLHRHHVGVHVLTKAGTAVCRDLDLLGDHQQDAVAATLTFSSLEDSRRWEPHAAPPSDRINALEIAHAYGIATWVSMEPVLDPDQSLALIERVAPFVGMVKLGGTNHVGTFPPDLRDLVSGIRWPEYIAAALEILDEYGTDYMIKEDLHRYVPAGRATRRAAQCVMVP